MEQSISKINEKISDLENPMNKTNENLASIENKSDNNHKEVIKRLNNIELLITELEPENAARHVEMNSNIGELHKDIKFIKHKLHVNEEEIFDIKDHLKLVK